MVAAAVADVLDSRTDFLDDNQRTDESIGRQSERAGGRERERDQKRASSFSLSCSCVLVGSVQLDYVSLGYLRANLDESLLKND